MKELLLILAIMTLSGCSQEFDSDKFNSILPGTWEYSENLDMGKSLFIKSLDKIDITKGKGYIIKSEQHYYSTIDDQFYVRLKANESGVIETKGNELFFTPDAIEMTYFQSNVSQITEKSMREKIKALIGIPQKYKIREYGPNKIILQDLEYDEPRVWEKSESSP